MSSAETVTLRRLAWAGVEVAAGDVRIVIDAIRNTEDLAGFQGQPRRPLPSIDAAPGVRTHAFVTHLHPDHCDRKLLAEVAASDGGSVGCHTPIVDVLGGMGVTAVPQEMGERRKIGPFTTIPVASHDWRGDDQVAWIVEAPGLRVIHFGDTIWHGMWWSIARDYGPFDVAFLPIAGVMARREGLTPTNQPATLTPEQAVEAAVVLQASTACAIHYDLFNNPPYYTEQHDVRGRFLRAARARGIHGIAPGDGKPVPLATAA
ncbi:MBL fold metallo-hydrolase [Streptomyces telluris]|uniref:MBL fold metallo-hydrolase n=1 Tax=Streptomyces telluris TaxID=2720021 RepID=A0A9X2RKE4_9ACTN|nr:MBL fold metallo-hydrolase [Streptomyces telluris]MCQ8769722.1 MBL fold metallo-hydrolase [Streptomyces telluris]NJP76122.1 MBL fold metallo-hydrolase [Streptomyces telluris]